MKNNKLIIITGAPCTGKTTLAQKLSEELKLFLISKDEIKELLFDTLGWKNREYSKLIGEASFAILYQILDRFMMGNQPIIVETSFKPSFDNRKFQTLLKKHRYELMQIYCKTTDEVLLKRFKERTQAKRHPGHNDENTLKEIQVGTNTNYTALNINGKIIELDTTDFSKVDYNKLLEQLRILI